ncbi:MAG: hypothetical protein NTV24_03310 [Candidatus Woesebacteria bacterium]|nr:hypothetical protein [Candidatus Woesebacteria bacterium]
MKKVVLPIIILVCVIVGYFCFQKYNIQIRPKGEISEITNSDKNYKIFSCRGGCPEFIGLVDFEGNGGSYTVVKIRTAMTRGAGKIIIIDDSDGKPVYDSGELPQIEAKIQNSPDKNDYKQTLEVTYTQDIYTYKLVKFTVYFDEKEQKLMDR